MAKNIEIQIKQGNNSYEILYPTIDLTNTNANSLPLSKVQNSSNLATQSYVTNLTNVRPIIKGYYFTSNNNRYPFFTIEFFSGYTPSFFFYMLANSNGAHYNDFFLESTSSFYTIFPGAIFRIRSSNTTDSKYSNGISFSYNYNTYNIKYYAVSTGNTENTYDASTGRVYLEDLEGAPYSVNGATYYCIMFYLPNSHV